MPRETASPRAGKHKTWNVTKISFEKEETNMKKRRLSILLSIVMLFSLLPTTALAASPTYVRVYNESGKLISLSDGQYLAQNSDKDSFRS